MITLSTFQEYLSAKKSLSQSQPPSMSRSFDGQERYLLKLLATLPSQTPAQQVEQLEKILTVLREFNIDEQQRLKLTATVIAASDQLIARLRQYYIYEIGELNKTQMAYVDQVKSLYYLIIMVYDKVLHHQHLLIHSRQKHSTSKGWKRYFKVSNDSSMMLATAMYQMLLMYQKLLTEEAICYQTPSSYLWFKINQLYSFAHQRHVVNINITVTSTQQRANNIHQLYCQICLLSLLNVRAIPRSNLLVVQRLLPEWAKYVVATIEPKTETRVFVDLHSDKPPAYLTANSDINPYEDHCHCLFIELTPLNDYLEGRVQAMIAEGSEGVECCLLNKLLMTIRYRYLQPPLMLTTKYAIKKEAILITGFNNIHYRVSGSQSFTNLIAMNELPEEQRPRYDTGRQKRGGSNLAISETLNSNDDGCLFLRLQLSPKVDSAVALTKESLNLENIHIEVANREVADGEFVMTGPLPVSTMSLCLICRSDANASPDWTMGVVRWLDFNNKNPEIEWQVLGHTLVACGVRLDGGKARSQYFVPAFILGRDEQLQTMGTLIVPTAYFQTDDRVVMRINNKQTPLCLGQRLLFTDEFSQYEVMKL